MSPTDTPAETTRRRSGVNPEAVFGTVAAVIEVLPTLAFMAGVYRMPTDGGPSSPRFRAYTEAATEGCPVSGYNPMTSKPVLPTVDGLLAIGAEDLLSTVANRTAAGLGFTEGATMHWTVATPGMWTDRVATEVEHRLLLRDPGGVLWWFDQPVSVPAVEATATAQTVRLASATHHGPPVTLVDAVVQEGAALAAAGATGALDPAAADALAVLADDPGLPTMVAFLLGDDAARALGFTPLGLGDRVGERHAVALARAATPRR